jgi:uncharacterized NAD(P)/FAD-binding protein YdhS
VTQHNGGIQVATAADGENRMFEADWLFNGTGTGTTASIASTACPLLRDLFSTGLARPDPLGFGIDAVPDGRVLSRAGIPNDRLCTLGPPLRGLWYETTAIPEIRAQAAALAQRITRDDVQRQRPGSAA